jgi:large-conductance mechanosensitive channel
VDSFQKKIFQKITDVNLYNLCRVFLILAYVIFILVKATNQDMESKQSKK